MKYIELLNIAKKQELNVTKLFIANEVNILIKEYIKEKNDKIFEHLCALVYEYYLKIDYASINDVAKIVCDLFINSQEIEENIIRKKLENMYL